MDALTTAIVVIPAQAGTQWSDDDAVWAQLVGDTSSPFAATVGGGIAVKVIGERGNELPAIRRPG